MVYFFVTRKNNLGPTAPLGAPVPTQTPTAPATSVDTSSWILYTNKTFGYSLKFPAAYQVPPQTAKEISQLGADNNIGLERKSDPSGSSVIVIDVNTDKGNVSLGDYVNKNLEMFGITGPLVSYNFNGYDALFNKNQPGANVFVKHGQYVYHITASTASSDKEIGDIVATFKFVTTAQSDKAVALLQENTSIQYIQRVIANGGTKAYLEPQNEKGDVAEVNLIEGNFPDNHTTRIDTFMVNVKTGEILVYDVANNKNISLKNWGTNIIQRFPDYGPQKVATVLVQDGSYYGSPFDPNLYQLEISKSEHLFAKSDLVDLKKYLGKNIKVHYREVRGVVMSEQQLVIVDSVEL